MYDTVRIREALGTGCEAVALAPYLAAEKTGELARSAQLLGCAAVRRVLRLPSGEAPDSAWEAPLLGYEDMAVLPDLQE